MKVITESFIIKKYGPLNIVIDKHYGGWFRLFGFGLAWTKGPMLFSERYGHVKKVKAFGYRWKTLTPSK